MLRPDGVLGRALRWVGTTRWGRLVIGPKVLTRLDRLAHRLSGGRVRVADLLFDTLVLTTTGRRSGEPRPQTLARLDLDGTAVVIASNFGREHHPAWSANLLADPRATVEHRRERYPVVARLLDEDERARVWPQAVRLWPGYETYRRTTDGIRDIRMFALDRTDREDGADRTSGG
jgi:deazaflavin-dependent oxidoreductase (nitroreductase family)